MSLASPQLRGLLEATHALRSSSELPEMLDSVARSLSRSLGFATVAIHLYRPAWHDYEAVVVHGSLRARRALLHTTRTVEECLPLLSDAFRHDDAYFIPHGGAAGRPGVALAEASDRDGAADPGAWHPDDALLVPLHSSTGEILGLLSVDEPRDGRRPGPDELETLAAVATQASLAIESAQRAQHASRRRAAAEHLLRVSAHLGHERHVGEMLEGACRGIAEALGFDRVTSFLTDREHGRLVPVASVGWSPEQDGDLPEFDLEDVAGLLRPELEREGCVLVDRAGARALTGTGVCDAHASWANGRGPNAWCDHWLLVPLHGRDGALLGLIWADDPRDRLRPGGEQLQLLRTFANQVTAAVESARQMERLRHLAERDTVTGLLNRRGYGEGADALLAAAAGPVALIVCDVDGFKRVNDVLGYEPADAVLRAVAATLRELCPADGLAARLGGDDFALVVPGADTDGALAASEELREAVARALTMVPWDVSMSAGVAVSGTDVTGAAGLLRAGTRALFAAKRLGRDRSVLYSPESLEVLLGTLEDGSGGEQLAAMILLAETLDLRDPHTARHSQTVGRHAEELARALGWSPERIERVRVAGVLHDIGKLGLPDAILHKAGPLDPREWTEIERHPEIGARILDHANLRDVAAWVLCHHERVDGTGYPRRLAGEEIPIEARILAVADSYEAMTADRPYRRGLPRERAMEELRRQRGSQFDAAVVDTFIGVLSESGGRRFARAQSHASDLSPPAPER